MSEQIYVRNIVLEIGDHIATKNQALAEIWRIKSSGYNLLSIPEQINALILQYRPVIMNIDGINSKAAAVMKDAYFSDQWIADFKQHVVPIIVMYGIA